MRESLALPVVEPSQAGEARRVASAMATRAGFDETGRGKIALIATEMVNNLIHHAEQGELILRVLGEEGGISGIELLAMDKGPGMADVRRCLTDGYSTGGTPGTGLGAVARMSHEFDVDSVPGSGTVMMSRSWVTAPNHSSRRIDVGAVCCPVAGEVECGDNWKVITSPTGRTLVMVADGLGHGPLAADASRAAIKTMNEDTGAGPDQILRTAHEAMRGTRGAAVAVAVIDHEKRELRYAGVGNIFGIILAPGARQGLVSHNGILGADARKFQEFIYAWPEGSLLVMHSDGLTTQWRLDRLSPLACKHPSLVAGALYRDHTRGRDDVTVVVVREEDPR